MSYESFSSEIMQRFRTVFVMILPTFPLADVIYGRSRREAPTDRPYMRLTYMEQEGDYRQIGKVTTQTALMMVDIFVPVVQDLQQVEQLADGVKRVIDVLIIPNGGFKRRLSKRDFGNEVGGFAHSRVSVTLNYDV